MTPQPRRHTSMRRPLPGTIEWEELPSLYDSLSGRLIVEAAVGRAIAGGAWTATVPAALEPSVESGPWCETMNGLSSREVLEPEVFRHFFGSPRA